MLTQLYYPKAAFILFLMLSLTVSCSKEKPSLSKDTIPDYWPQATSEALSEIARADSALVTAARLFRAEFYDSSKYFYENAISILEKYPKQLDSLKKWGKLVNSHLYVGEVHRIAHNPTKALISLNRALSIGINKLSVNSSEVATTYHAIGNVYLIKSNNDSALYYYNRALKMRLQLYGENHLDVASVLGNIAIIYRRLADYHKALEAQKRSAKIRSNILGQNDYQLVTNYHNLGKIYIDLGDYDKALYYLQRAVSIRTKSLGEYNLGVANNYNVIGVVLQEKGDYDKALQYFEKALNIVLKLGKENSTDAAAAVCNIGQIYALRGDYKTGLDYFRKSLEIKLLFLAKDHPDLCQIYQDIGHIYDNLRDYDHALLYHKKTLDISVSSFGKVHPEVANAYFNISNSLAGKNQLDSAREYLTGALNIYTNLYGHDHMSIARCYLVLGDIFYLKGNLNSAEKYYLRSLKLTRHLGGNLHPQVADNYRVLGDLYLKQYKFVKAFKNYQNSMASVVSSFTDTNIYINPPLRSFLSEQSLLKTLIAKASAFVKLAYKTQAKPTKQRYFELAISTFDLATSLVDSMRFSYKSETSKLILAETSMPIYEQAILASLNLQEITGDSNYTRKAFSFAQKSKAVVLSESLRESHAKQFAGIPDGLLANEKQLRIDLSFYETELQKEKFKKDGRDSLKIVEFESRHFDLSQQYNTLLKKFAREYPRYYSLKYTSITASVPEIQKALNAQTTLVEYFVGDSTLVIFTITKSEFVVKSLPKDKILLKEIKEYQEALKVSNDDDYKKSAFHLHQALIKPIENAISDKDLLIIPDVVLSEIPFEALLTRDSDAISKDYRRLPYLINDHAISYAYSVSLWLESVRQKREVMSGAFLALAPIFSNGLPAQSRGAELFAANNGHDTTRAAFGALPMTRAEVLGVKTLFDQNAGFFARWFDGIFNKRTLVYLEKDASERKLKSENIANYRYVHLATHGFANYAAPDLSGLAFADDSSSSEDGVLFLREVYNLKLNADLVVLSACESGAGKLSRGEGLLGLSRGFIYAGAKNLLVSLWQVNDASTAKLMREFYAAMLAGQSKAAALRQAKQHLINSRTANPKFAMPYYWAPFILIGQ
ncbi:MAG: Photosystem I assembly protein Ycf3 [Syntrophorhabdaceae bacterium]|nr:Photosystem I assembly protein Ycf3 [Syntrophorhabdaceae bacterium]